MFSLSFTLILGSLHIHSLALQTLSAKSPLVLADAGHDMSLAMAHPGSDDLVTPKDQICDSFGNPFVSLWWFPGDGGSSTSLKQLGTHTIWTLGTICWTDENPAVVLWEHLRGQLQKPLNSDQIGIGSTWGRGWMTKASGVGERRKGRGELRRDCHHRVAALFVPTRMQQWYMIYDIWYMIYDI